MKKVRFFKSIFLEAFDQRVASILESYKANVKQTDHEFQNQQLKLDKKINEALNFLITSKDSGIVEYKLRQLYAVEKYTTKRTAFIGRKSILTTLISMFEEILIELRAILVTELCLLDQEVLQITPPHLLHSTIIRNLPIYSKTVNSSWMQIKEAIEIESSINKDVEELTGEQKGILLKIKSVKNKKLKSEIQIAAFVDCKYHQDLIRVMEVYFVEMNDIINQLIKK